MLSNFYKWTITYISKITLSICGLSLFSLALYFIFNNRLISVLDVLPVYFSFLKMDWTILYIKIPSGTYVALDILRLFLIATMIIGAIIYLQSNRKEKKLLYFSYAIIFIGSIFNFADFLFRRAFKGEFDEIYSFITRDDYKYYWVLETFTVCTWLLLIMISYSILKHWNNETKLIVNTEILPGSQVKSSNWKRFFHFVFDLIIFLCIASDFMQNLLNVAQYKLSVSSGFKDVAIPILLFVFTIIYYTVFEYLFHITPSKVLSHSKLININKSHITISNVLGRSFARHIPFNAISFLFNSGWHDTLTETTVVDVEEKTNYVIIYWVLFIMLVISLVVNYIINPFS